MSCENPLLLAITMLQDYKGDLAGREFPNTDEGNHLQVINENKRASVDAAIAGLHQLRAGMAAPAPVLVPDNLLSHRTSWQRAFQRLIELEPASSEPDRDDRGYWKHEAQAMQDMYAVRVTAGKFVIVGKVPAAAAIGADTCTRF